MKKIILFAFILSLGMALTALADPAYPGRIDYIQPDGSHITIRLFGDEFGHWATDEAGNILEQDEEGFWRVSSRLSRSSLDMLQNEAAARRAAASEARKAATNTSANFGSPRIPVILVGFNKKAFTKSNADFDSMLNQKGYSANNAKGSVLDYFTDNSFGPFTPIFDVLGPVTLDNEISYYGGNNSNGDDKLPEMALVHAAQKLDATVDFSQYDNDHDGTVDFVLFYFAGCDEAQGASSDAIWSHAWYLSYSPNTSTEGRTFDGVKLDRYFCTAELKGSSGSTMCSIGTTCHEFAHTLGLPDFYDANYSTNGSAANMYSFDLMANGSYNGNSTRPPYLNAEEVYEIGWLSEIPELSNSGSVSLPPVNYPGATQYSAYKTKTSVNGEYFVYETRAGQGWDASIGHTGLLVYHVDKSSNKVSGSITAASVWNSNAVNNYSAHPCCYVVPAGNPTSSSLYSGSAFLFGSSSYTSFTPKAWDGNTTGFSLTGITYSNGTVTFNVTNSNTKGITGSVTDTDGHPISGASITVTEAVEASPAPSNGGSSIPSKLINKARMLFKPAARKNQPATKAPASYSAVTGSDGLYMIEVPSGTYQVSASAEGYVAQTATVQVTSTIESMSFCLMREGESLPDIIYAWPTDLVTEDDEYMMGAGTNSLTGQNLYPASELAPYLGKQIKEFTFYLVGNESTTYSGVNVIIDYGDNRKATVPVSSSDLTIGGYTTVDLRDLNLVIPANTDIYAGVGFSSGGYLYENNYYFFGGFYKTDENDNPLDWAADWPYNGLVSEYNLTSTGTRYSWDVLFDFTMKVGDFEAPDTGYNHISDPGNGIYQAGDMFEFNLIETAGSRKPQGAIEWYYDDERITEPSVMLTYGSHIVEARFTTAEGGTKTVELELSVGQ